MGRGRGLHNEQIYLPQNVDFYKTVPDDFLKMYLEVHRLTLICRRIKKKNQKFFLKNLTRTYIFNFIKNRLPHEHSSKIIGTYSY